MKSVPAVLVTKDRTPKNRDRAPQWDQQHLEKDRYNENRSQQYKYYYHTKEA